MPCRMLFTLAVLALSIPLYAEEATRQWQNQMLEAAAAGDWNKLKDAISKGADPRGRTILHWAAGESHTADLKRFIEGGASLEVKDQMGWTPLALAAFAGEADSVRILIDHGAGVHTRDQEGSTPLHLALVSGHRDVAELLLEAGADSEAEDHKGQTPLFSAVTNYRSPEVVRWLLGIGANTSAVDRNGDSPLAVAHKRLAEATGMAEAEQPAPDWILERVQGYTEIVRVLEEK